MVGVLRHPGHAAALAPVGLVIGSRLCGLRVFVDQPAEYRASLNTGRSEIDYLRRWVRWSLVEGSVWPLAVVVDGVLAQDARHVPFTDDQHPVGALPPHRADPAFRESIRPRRPWRRAEHVDTSGSEHRVERRGELRVTVTQQEPSNPCKDSIVLVDLQLVRPASWRALG